MMKNKNAALKTAFLTSCSFAGYNIGSGFATGLEGQQFFASWGSPKGFIALIIAMLATAFVLVPVYLTGYNKKADTDYNVYHFYCGDKLGKFIDLYMYFSILLVILTMMSGAGATINQYFGIPKFAGAAILCTICILAALLGLEKLMHVLSYAGVLIIAFVFGCTVYLHFAKGLSLSVPFETINGYAESGQIARIGIFGFSSPLLCGVASSGLLIISGLPWVASTGALCKNKRNAVMSGIFSAIIFYAAEAVCVYLNLICFDKIVGEEVPILAVFQRFIPSLAMLYSCIIILAIFSTVSGRLFLFADRVDRGNKKAHIAIIILVCVLAALGGTFIPFSKLSNFMFTINGCLGIFLGVIIIIKTLLKLARHK